MVVVVLSYQQRLLQDNKSLPRRAPNHLPSRKAFIHPENASPPSNTTNKVTFSSIFLKNVVLFAILLECFEQAFFVCKSIESLQRGDYSSTVRTSVCGTEDPGSIPGSRPCGGFLYVKNHHLPNTLFCCVLAYCRCERLAIYYYVHVTEQLINKALRSYGRN